VILPPRRIEKELAKHPLEWHPGPPATCVAQKHGNFTEAGCKTVAEKKGKPDHKGTYEKACSTSCAAGAIHTGSATLTVTGGGAGTVSCEAGSGEYEITGLKSLNAQITFSGCTQGAAACQSVGPNGVPSGVEGQITSNELEGRLIASGESSDGYRGEGPEQQNEVWNELKSAQHEPYLAEFECGGVARLRTSGVLSAGVTPVNREVETSTQVFSETIGEQALLTEADSPETGDNWTAPAPSIEVTEATLSGDEEFEIRDNWSD
jgi:hypothetical protein